jgi:hypothetical protein
LQWLQDPSEINEDNLNNVRREVSRYFRNKKREYLKDKISELATNNNSNNIRGLYRGINEFKKGYQLRNNLVKDENGNLLPDSHNFLNRWKNYFSQLLNVHNVSEVRQMKYIGQPLVPGPSSLELIQTGEANSVWNKEELPDQWKESIIVPVHKKGDKTDCNNYHGISLPSTSYKILSSIFLSRSGPYIDEIIGDL